MRHPFLSTSAFILLAFGLLASAPSARDLPLRITAGAGIGDRGMPGLSGRILVSPTASRLCLGAQGMYFEEFLTFKSPDESIGSGHLVVGWEALPEGPLSLMFLGGLGGAHHVLRGKRQEGEYDPSSFFQIDEYETRAGFGPSALAGVDVGLTWRRRLGVSVFLGLQVAKITQPFVQAQLDVGSW